MPFRMVKSESAAEAGLACQGRGCEPQWAGRVSLSRPLMRARRILLISPVPSAFDSHYDILCFGVFWWS
jgi:hypothetical protein